MMLNITNSTDFNINIDICLCLGAHDGSVQASTVGTYGSCNDKTLIRFDEYINEIRSEELYTNIEYDLMISEKHSIKQKGVYSIVDGGYHHWVSTMSASRIPTNPDFVAWRQQLESVRKDIEDIFGVVKGRFRILKLPVLFHKKHEIDNMFLTCIGLHNMLHIWDGRDQWECGVEWGGTHGKFSDGDGGEFWGRPRVKRSNGLMEYVKDEEDFSKFGRFYFSDNQVPIVLSNFDLRSIDDIDIEKLVERHTERDSEFYALQSKLVKHHSIQRKTGKIRWLRS